MLGVSGSEADHSLFVGQFKTEFLVNAPRFERLRRMPFFSAGIAPDGMVFWLGEGAIERGAAEIIALFGLLLGESIQEFFLSGLLLVSEPAPLFLDLSKSAQGAFLDGVFDALWLFA